jgi:transposase
MEFEGSIVRICLQTVRALGCWPGYYLKMNGDDAWRTARYVLDPCHQPPDLRHPGTATRPATTFPASWDALSDVDALVDEVLVELAAMAADGTRPTRSGPKPTLAGEALRRAIMAIWCTGFCGMQWRAIGELSGIPFGTLFSLFARWTRLGLWRRLLDRLRRTWRLACGDTAEPSTVVIDSRSCRSAPSCFTRG